MKRAWKKVLSLVLTTSMVLSVLPTIAFAEGCEHECSIENGCITEECLHEHGEDCYQSVLSCEEEHEHDADCYAEELSCDHVCTAESGCIAVNCLHECDEVCGGLENVSTGGGQDKEDDSTDTPAEEPTAADLLNEKIAALPSARKIAKMSDEEKAELSAELDAIYEEIEMADEETIAALDLGRFEKAMAALTDEADTLDYSEEELFFGIFTQSVAMYAGGMETVSFDNIEYTVKESDGEMVEKNVSSWGYLTNKLNTSKTYTITVTKGVQGWEPAEGTVIKLTPKDGTSDGLYWKVSIENNEKYSGDNLTIEGISSESSIKSNDINITPVCTQYHGVKYKYIYDDGMTGAPLVYGYTPWQIANNNIEYTSLYFNMSSGTSESSLFENFIAYDVDGKKMTAADCIYKLGKQDNYPNTTVEAVGSEIEDDVEVVTLRWGNSYKVNIDDNMKNGTITANKSTSLSGTDVTLTIKPEKGYKFKDGTLKITYTSDGNEKEVEYNAIGDTNTTTFPMPAEDVTVTAEFEEKPVYYVKFKIMDNKGKMNPTTDITVKDKEGNELELNTEGIYVQEVDSLGDYYYTVSVGADSGYLAGYGNEYDYMARNYKYESGAEGMVYDEDNIAVFILIPKTFDAGIQILDNSGNDITETATRSISGDKEIKENQDGTFTVEKLDWGADYTLTASADGYKEKSVDFSFDKTGRLTVGEGGQADGTTVKLQLDRQTVDAKIKIVDGDNNAVLTNDDKTAITITDKDGKEAAKNTADAISDGVFTATGLNWGEDYTLKITSAGYEEKSFKFSLDKEGIVLLPDDSNDGTIQPEADGTITVKLERKTYNAKIEIVDDACGDNVDHASDVDFEVTDSVGTKKDITKVTEGTERALGCWADGLKWGETYTLTVKDAPGFAEPQEETSNEWTATFSFDRDGTLTVDGRDAEVVDNKIVRKTLQANGVQIWTKHVNGGSTVEQYLNGVEIKVTGNNNEQLIEYKTGETSTSGNGYDMVYHLIAGVTYTIHVTEVPTNYAIPADITFTIDEYSKLATINGADTEEAVIDLIIWNSIKVDADGDGTVASTEENAKVGKAENGIYTDAEGENKKTYLPVDVNGDGETDHYVPDDVLTDEDGNGIWTNPDGNAFYVPSGYDKDTGKPTGFIKVVDFDNDGVYGEDNGNGEEKDTPKYIPDVDGDKKPEVDTDGDGVFDGSKKDNTDKYIPNDKDGDEKKEEILVDSNGDGIFTPADENGKEKETPDEGDISYIPDQDDDGKPEPDKDKDGIYEGSGSDTTYIPNGKDDIKADSNGDGVYGEKDEDGNEKDWDKDFDDRDKNFVPVDKDGKIDGVEQVTPQPDGTLKNEENGNSYLPDRDGDRLPEPDINNGGENGGAGVFEGTKGEIKYIPDQDDDAQPEPDTNGDGIYEGTYERDGTSNSYIPDNTQNDDGKTEYFVDDNQDGIYGRTDDDGNEESGEERKYFVPVDKDEDGVIDGVKEVTKKNEHVYVDGDGDGTEYIPDVDGDGLPEPDTNGDGIFEGTKDGTKYEEDGSKYAPSTESNGSSHTSKIYNIVVKDTEDGTVKSSDRTAKKGETITLTVKADKNYELRSLTVLDRDGGKVEVKDNGDDTYSFTMPRSSVTVTAKFSGEAITADDVEQKDAILLTINQKLAMVFGEAVMNDVAPVIRNERTMLPIRFVVENLGGTVAWNEAEKKVTIVKEDTIIEIFIGQSFANVNGERIALDSPAFIENSRTYLPLRFVAENLDATVLWKAATQQVFIVPNENLNQK